MKKKKQDTPHAIYLAGMENIGRLQAQTAKTIAGIEESALRPMLAAIKKSLSGRWKKLLVGTFSFKPPGAEESKKWNMQEALVRARDPMVVTVYPFTAAELKKAGFASVMDCLKSLKALNKTLGGDISVKSQHELVGVGPEHVGDTVAHLYFEIGISYPQRTIRDVKINTA